MRSSTENVGKDLITRTPTSDRSHILVNTAKSEYFTPTFSPSSPLLSNKRVSTLISENATKRRKTSEISDIYEEARTGETSLEELSRCADGALHENNETKVLNDPPFHNPGPSEDWLDAFDSPSKDLKDSSTPLIPTKTPTYSYSNTSRLHNNFDSDDQFEAISIYQSKVITLQKGQINLLTELLKNITLDPERTAKLETFKSEIAGYESCIEPLKKHSNGTMSLNGFSPISRLVTKQSLLQNDEEKNAETSSFDVNKKAECTETPLRQTTPSEDIPIGSSMNAPLDLVDDEMYSSNDEIVNDNSDSLPPPTIFPPVSGVEILSSDNESDNVEHEVVSDIEETDAFENTSSSPQGVKMKETSATTGSNPQYPWSANVRKTLRTTFKLSEFRRNQLEAINGTLMGKDVFVLMPTGGGKSLCYQLPALIDSGTTKGSTIVVSPLISLMQDQTYHLKKRGISAEMLSSRLQRNERTQIFKSFLSGSIRLLYISPEMLNSSKQLRNAIQTLAGRNQLARIVIDEAHCVSSWGHDFRPDYKLLENLKYDFPSIPIMALTATANERVCLDIFKCLRQENTMFLKQSFNRANLYYAVKEKSKDVNEVIAKLMKTKFQGKSGIIYCHSRASCERTAISLQNAGLSVTFYHALLTHEERESVQSAWHNGRIQAICATIAFGMGIDKPDVRFVFHLTLPRNMEGYYQETGRAGRDGLSSECVLFYHNKDALTLQSMINKDDLEPQVKANHKEMLKRVIQYCQNFTDCRRKQVLQYFNETFDVRQCRKGCDNCRDGHNQSREIRDVTDKAKEILELVYSIQRDNVTLIHCIDVYRGSRSKKILEKGHDKAANYGVGKTYDRTETERIFHHLVTEAILDEYSIYSGAFSSSYIKRGTQGTKVTTGRLKVTMVFNNPTEIRAAKETPTRAAAKSKTAASSNTDKTVKKNTPAKKAATGDKSNQVKVRSTTAETPNSPFIGEYNDPAWTFQENCYGKLEVRRFQLKRDFDLPQVSDVCSDTCLENMAKILPVDLESFSKLKKITPLQVENFYMYFRPELVKLKQQREEQQRQKQNNSAVDVDEEQIAQAFMDDVYEFEEEENIIAEFESMATKSKSKDLPSKRKNATTVDSKHKTAKSNSSKATPSRPSKGRPASGGSAVKMMPM